MLPTMEYEELDDSTKIGKAIKSVTIKNAKAMAYMIQCLRSKAMLNATSNIKAQAGWPTGRACQLFNNLKHKYNPNDKLSRMQMIKNLMRLSLRREMISR